MSQIKSEPYVGPWASLTPKTDKKYQENSSHFPFESIAPVVFRTIVNEIWMPLFKLMT